MSSYFGEKILFRGMMQPNLPGITKKYFNTVDLIHYNEDPILEYSLVNTLL